MVHYLIRLLPWILVAALFFPVFQGLAFERWQTLDYDHAYFIFPLALAMAWSLRSSLARKSQGAFAGKVAGLLFLISGLGLFWFGWQWDYLLIQTFSLLPVLFGLVAFLFGFPKAAMLGIPILYLGFLLPPPIGVLDAITLPMRELSSIVAENVLHLLHYPVSREGLLLFLGNHEIFMGAPCSGFRSLITFLALGSTFVFFRNGKALAKSFLVAAIIPLALIGNFIRVIILCLITYHFGAEVGQSFLHEFSGIVIFVILILGLLALDRIFLRDHHDHEAAPATEPTPLLQNRSTSAFLVAVLLVGGMLLATHVLPKPKYQGNLLSEISIPESMPGWKSIDGRELIQSGKDDRYNFISNIFARIYGTEDGRSLLFLVLDAGNFHHPKVCFTKSGYKVEELQADLLSLGQTTLKLYPMVMQKKEARYLVVYWIIINGKQTDWVGQKWGQFWSSLLQQKRGGLMMRIDMPLTSQDAADELHYMREFIGALSESTSSNNSEHLLGN